MSLVTEELAVLNTLCDATNAFMRLPVCHPAERDEWAAAMHRLQDLVMMRSAVRSHPDIFRLGGEFK